ncbi:MAG: phosphodiester glycosidase family protein [Desulfobacterales bacterium]|nr:MAG: phosphodiester glycosidase family protein [Desulfobacterales bacterium]
MPFYRQRWQGTRPDVTAGLVVLVFALIALTVHATVRQAFATESRWQVLEPGLSLGIFPATRASQFGDSLIRVLRIDPHRFELRLLNASAPGKNQRLTPKEWCQNNGLVAAINASMYQKDLLTSVSLMRTKTHTNNSRLSKDNTILAFDRQAPDVPLVRIIDRECEIFDDWKHKYGTLVQSIRMISCARTNVWMPQEEKWSTAAIGIDHAGRVLFIHVRSPYSTHDLINILLELPLEISRAMYVEGGPEAQLYVKSGEQEYEFLGRYDMGLSETVDFEFALQIPNVVGVAPRRSPVK